MRLNLLTRLRRVAAAALRLVPLGGGTPGADFVGSGERYDRTGPEGLPPSLVGCEPAALQALVEVVSGGRGFDNLRRLRARFLGNLFNSSTAGRYLRAGLDWLVWERAGGGLEGVGPNSVYRQIDAASALGATNAERAACRRAAIWSTRWGLGLIRGCDHARAGYDSAEKMVEAFKTGEAAQLAAFAAYLQAIGAGAALRAVDVEALARRFAGARQPAREAWAARYSRAYARLTGARPWMILEQGDSGAPVARLQSLLRETGQRVRADGEFGDATAAAVATLQAAANAGTDGRGGRAGVGPVASGARRRHRHPPVADPPGRTRRRLCRRRRADHRGGL